jgi:tRNA-specific 2-thiouridylase
MPDAYNPRVIEHLVRPRNTGEIPDPAGRGESGDSACGDVACFTVVVSGNVVEEVRYQAYGCAACVAAGSALAGMVDGKHLLEAARVSKADLEDALGGPLPAGKEHALTLVLDALHKAFEDHLNRGTGETLVGGYGGPGEDGGQGVVAAMSGGVDSAVTALLLKEAGHDVAAVTFRLHDGERGSRSCCSPDTVLFARDTAHRMGLPHFTLNLKELFDRRVMRDFVGSYEEGRTPNPCVSCNAHVKFHAAAFLADELGFRRVATGHYARVGDGPSLARPVDESKDQTYVLWPIPNELWRGPSSRSASTARRRCAGSPRTGAWPSPTPPRARTSALSPTATTAGSCARPSPPSPGTSWTGRALCSGATRAWWTSPSVSGAA